MATAKPPVIGEVVHNFDMRGLAAILIKHEGIREGVFEVSINFQLSVGGVAVNEKERNPGAVIAVTGVGLSNAQLDQPNAVNAAEVNPA